MLTIVPYQPKYAQNFKELNLAWITEYFFVEEKDRELLDNCESSIIEKGGYIFIGLWNNVPVGCFALLKISEFNFELGKIILYSSTKLETALHIYKKLGFKEVSLENNNFYLRSDIKMELTL